MRERERRWQRSTRNSAYLFMIFQNLKKYFHIKDLVIQNRDKIYKCSLIANFKMIVVGGLFNINGKRVILAKCAADCKKSWTGLVKRCGVFACERILVNPPALSTDCPRLRVNEVRIESRWGSRQTKTQHGEA